MNLYPRVCQFVREQPWALRPETLATMLDVLRVRASGGILTRDEIAGRIGVKADRARESWFDCDSGETWRQVFDDEGGSAYRSEGGRMQAARPKGPVIAVLGVIGIISQRASQVDDISGPGGTSIEKLTASFRAALEDQAVKGIAFDVDSPGGGVYGVPELAREIRAARSRKPVKAVSNSLAASAAYYLASQADEVVVTPSGEVGSIGVYAAHEDWSRAMEQEGVKVTLISAGRYKTEANPFEPLTDEARAWLQTRVDEYFGLFVADVAAGRGQSRDAVRKDFGEGRVVGAKDAVSRGMADRIGTLDETIRRMANLPARTAITQEPTPAQQQIDPRQIAAARMRTL